LYQSDLEGSIFNGKVRFDVIIATGVFARTHVGDKALDNSLDFLGVLLGKDPIQKF